MSTYTTTFAELLKATKAALVLAQNTTVAGQRVYPQVADVRTFQLGPLSPQSIFPAVVIVPEQRAITERFSGGLINVVRTVSLYVYVKAIKVEQAREPLLGILREAREVLQTNFQLKDHRGDARTFRLFVGDAEITEVSSVKQSALWQARQEMSFLSREQLPSRTMVNPVQTDQKTLMDTIESIVEANKVQFFISTNPAGYGRSMFATYQFWQEVPIAQFPALVVVTTGETTEEIGPGRDFINRAFQANILTRWGREDKGVLDLCDLSEKLSDFLYINSAMRGKAVDTTVGTITYGTLETENVWMFQAIVPFTCRCWETVKYVA